MTPPLPPALAGERFEFTSRSAGQLSVYSAGEGPPLLLVHSINASGSAAEMRPLYEHFQRSRRVFAIDLPGFGFSERSDRPYLPRLMTDAILATVREIQARCGGAKIDALALSLSSEFLARAEVEASRAPEGSPFASLALVSPTGFSGRRSFRGPEGSNRGQLWLYRLLRGPNQGWGGAVFRGLTRPGVIRYFLERTWGSKRIDEALWAYDILSAAQPGAEHAPLHFLSAQLFSADIHTVYEALKLPVWMSHGIRGDFTDFRQTGLVSGNGHWHFSVFPTGALCYFEEPQAFCAAYEAFLHRRTLPSP
jgi:pimeloyl-ACP methyl ester carboxylesterase